MSGFNVVMSFIGLVECDQTPNCVAIVGAKVGAKRGCVSGRRFLRDVGPAEGSCTAGTGVLSPVFQEVAYFP